MDTSTENIGRLADLAARRDSVGATLVNLKSMSGGDIGIHIVVTPKTSLKDDLIAALEKEFTALQAELDALTK